MNLVVMVGRLTKDPELRFVAGSGKAVCNFDIAVDRPFSKEKTADFFRVVVWGKPAENAAKYLTKGKEVAIRGYLTTRNYDDKEGIKRYVTEIVADEVQFVGHSKQIADERPADDFKGFEPIEDDGDELPWT